VELHPHLEVKVVVMVVVYHQATVEE